MHENRLRAARGGLVRRPSAAATTARVRTVVGRHRPASGTAPAKPSRPRRVRRIRGRFAGTAGPTARDDQARL